MSAKLVISRDLVASRHNHLFFLIIIIYLFFISIFHFIFHRFTENMHCRVICIAIATDVIGWPERIKKVCIYISREQI